MLSHPRPRGRRVFEFPVNPELERIEEVGSLFVGDMELLKTSQEPHEVSLAPSFGRLKAFKKWNRILSICPVLEERKDSF
jgi:hypothetical protein